MEESQSTAAPNNGASNSADFQPPTKSPQSAPVADVQQQSGLQDIKNPQEFFNDNKGSKISVTAQPAPAQAQVKNDPTGLVIVAVIAIVVAIILYKLSNKLPTRTKVKKVEPAPVAEPAEVQVAKTEPETKPKKSPAKRKSTKKTKRRNR